MNDKQQPDTQAQELDEQKLDQAGGSYSFGATNSASARKPPATTGNKPGQDDWLVPR